MTGSSRLAAAVVFLVALAAGVIVTSLLVGGLGGSPAPSPSLDRPLRRFRRRPFGLAFGRGVGQPVVARGDPDADDRPHAHPEADGRARHPGGDLVLGAQARRGRRP